MRRYLLILGMILMLQISAACSAISPASVIPTVTLVPGMGRVIGILQVGTTGNAQPAKNSILYLSEIIKDNAGNESFATMDRIRSPKTNTDDEGHFVFSNVPPGKYCLVLDIITNSYLLFKPGTQDALFIQVSAGGQADFGTLIYDSLPQP